MGPRKSRNPLAFTALPVTVITVVVYIALAVALLYIHHVVPTPPDSPTPINGINITEAWHDLQTLSAKYHPYNSRQNDWVRSWLLERIDKILTANEATYLRESQRPLSPLSKPVHIDNAPPSVIVFDDNVSNAIFTSPSAPLAVYFEGTNIMVYIRGTQDGNSDWWRNLGASSTDNKRGVLVNAHYDSVSTGFGATDDGVGVVSVLQLIKYFSTGGNQPERGVVALFNNGEEDFLNGARAFMQHPISRFPDTFLNLEGAGAGGRAALFRSTDVEVTRAYRKSPNPLGTVVSGDTFSSGVIRSQTDYVVFNGELGLRGLDVAFFEPRARYHTSEDSARYTSKGSLWHMLSAALATTQELSSDTETKYSSRKGHLGVWFDLFGQAFAVAELHTMFAISVSFLVAAPIIMIILSLIIGRLDKYYLFARRAKTDSLDPRSPDEDTVVQLNGWRGLFRFPIAFVFATAAVVGLAFLVTKLNPYIVYSSPYAVWSMMLSAWFCVAWFFLRGADYMRPTALHRAHIYGWLFVGAWLVLAFDTIAENNFRIAGGYVMVFYFVAIFLCLLISYLEFFALPKKHEYVQASGYAISQSRPISSHRRAASIRSSQVQDSGDGAESSVRTREGTSEPSETTSLLGGARKRGKFTRSRDDEDLEDEIDQPLPNGRPPYGDEQPWSGTLPSWLWVIQFLLLGPIMIILLGEIGLYATSALYQTPADGSPVMVIYGTMAFISVLILIPIVPFLHRFTSRIPIFLFFILIGTVIYNLLAFPFSEQNRLKVFFSQEIDVTTGISKVSLSGLDGYVQDVIGSIPSATGQNAIECLDMEKSSRKGLRTCSWNGPAPNVVGSISNAKRSKYPTMQVSQKTWVSVNATRLNTTQNEATFRIVGKNTRACKLMFDSPISMYDIVGAATQDDRFSHMPKDGANEIRLWSREWDKPWTVKVQWEDSDKKKKTDKRAERTPFKGKAVCLWSDANEPGVIPAFDEVKNYLPLWAAVTKNGDGLVEGYKSFSI